MTDGEREDPDREVATQGFHSVAATVQRSGDDVVKDPQNAGDVLARPARRAGSRARVDATVRSR
jgi:hypothetical protein